MAIIKQGILGGFTGKVAGVVGTSWKGRAVMKGRPQSVSNPKTDAQVEQRGKFSAIAELAASILTTFVQPVENPISGNISGYNRFVKDNKTAFDALGKIVVGNFKCGGGKLPFVSNFNGYAVMDGSEVSATWQNDASLSPLRLTDKVYAASFKPDGTLVGVSSGVATRNDRSVHMELIDPTLDIRTGDRFIILLACVSADGREVSVESNAIEITATED